MKGIKTGDYNPQGLKTEEFATIKVMKRLNRSIPMFLLQHLIKPAKGYIISPKGTIPGGSQQLEPDKRVRGKIDASERKVDDIYIYDILPKKKDAKDVAITNEKQAKRIYYFAGGGWHMLPSGEHWSLVAELAMKLPDAAVSLVSYPLAPNSAAPIAFPMLMKLYRTLMREATEAGESVILAGDSSGGNIVLSLLTSALLEDDEQQSNGTAQSPLPPHPTSVLVISPSTDLRRQNSDIHAIARKDPILKLDFINSTAQKWRGEWSPLDIRVSPLYADLTPIARRGIKVHGVCGRYDILAPDAVLFREKCSQSRVEGEWLDWEKQMHCFPLAFAFHLPECVEAKDWILDVLRRA